MQLPGSITVGVPVFYTPTYHNRFHCVIWPSHTPVWTMLLLCCIIFIWHLCWTVLLAWLTKPNLLLENEWQASSIPCASRATLLWPTCELNGRPTWKRKCWRWIRGWYFICWIRTALMPCTLQQHLKWCYLDPLEFVTEKLECYLFIQIQTHMIN